MFTRYTIRKQPEEIARHFNAELPPGFQMKLRFNGSVKTDFPVIKPTESGRTLAMMNWSLIPSNKKEQYAGFTAFSTYNALAKNVATSPSFKSAFESRRCLIPADGFFLFKDKAPNTIETQAYFVRFKDERLFAMAGLWEKWRDIETFTIVVTSANDTLKSLYLRMPVILSENDYDIWLDPSKNPTRLYEPFQSDDLIYTEADPKIKNSENDYSEILEYAPIAN